jgi:hypothetical protein
MHMLLSKLEVDVFQAGELTEVTQLAIKHGLPALVVHQGLINDAFIARGKGRGKFKLIAQIGWNKNPDAGAAKFRHLPIDALESDGFEVVLSPASTASALRSEAMEIGKFVRDRISTQTEIRYVLSNHSGHTDHLKAACEGLQSVPTPAMVRNHTEVKLPATKANDPLHWQMADTIKGILQVPLKMSGNYNGFNSFKGNGQYFHRYGVNLLQLKSILKGLATIK